MNHRERLLDIANEAIDRLLATGMSQAQICRLAGISWSAFRDWKTRTACPVLDALEPLLNLAGAAFELHVVYRDAPRALLRPVGTPRKGCVSRSVYIAAAEQLGVFSAPELAIAAGVTEKAAKNWVQRYRRFLGKERIEHCRGGRRIIWRWVGEPVAQAQAAE